MTNKKQIRILWLGNILEESMMLSAPAVSPAANRWQSGLLGALSEANCDVRILGHQPEPVWPKGCFRMQCDHRALGCLGFAKVPQISVGYWNLLRLRGLFLSRQYVLGFRQFLRDGFRPDYILSYNMYPVCLSVVKEARSMGIPWVPVIADVSADPSAIDYFAKQLDQAAGCIFLSWNLFEKSKVNSKLHLDGGSSDLKFNPKIPESYLPSSPPTVFYSGSVVMEFGLAMLIEAFFKISNPEVRLVICGKGSNKTLADLAKRDARIMLMGCLEDEKLTRLAQQSSVMVNPRPNLPDHDNNFPSKVLEYLSYGKPVVSTWTPGLHPVYRSLLTVVAENTPDAMADKINDSLAWSNKCRAEHAAKCALFIRQEKLWEEQARRLIDWLGKSI